MSTAPNKNVNAPAGYGGDKWGANGGGITAIGNGTSGQSGWSESVLAAQSDGELASNYIVTDVRQPKSVQSTEANTTLAHGFPAAQLPQTNANLGTVG